MRERNPYQETNPYMNKGASEKKGLTTRQKIAAGVIAAGVIGATIGIAAFEASEHAGKHQAAVEQAIGAFHLQAGESAMVPAGSVVTGDVCIVKENGEKMAVYDNARDTGHVVILEDKATIYAPEFVDKNGRVSGGASGQVSLASEGLRVKTAQDYAVETFKTDPYINTVFVVEYNDGNISTVNTIDRP